MGLGLLTTLRFWEGRIQTKTMTTKQSIIAGAEFSTVSKHSYKAWRLPQGGTVIILPMQETPKRYGIPIHQFELILSEKMWKPLDIYRERITKNFVFMISKDHKDHIRIWTLLYLMSCTSKCYYFHIKILSLKHKIMSPDGKENSPQMRASFHNLDLHFPSLHWNALPYLL